MFAAYTNNLLKSYSGHRCYYECISRIIGLLPLRRQAIASYLMRKRGLQTAPLRTGAGWWIIVPDLPGSWTPAYGIKEPDVHYYISRCLKRANAFVDCGAHLGWYSLYASKYPNIREVIAIEPVRRSVQYLNLLKAINSLHKLRIIEGCVTDRDGLVDFAFDDNVCSEHGHVALPQDEYNCRSLVPGYTLETILRGLQMKRLCVKIDVEGHEASVLASVKPATLRQFVDSMLVEVHLYKFIDPCAELQQICELVTPVSSPTFLINAPVLYSGWQRFLRHMFHLYPARDMSINRLCDLIRYYKLPDLFVLVQQNSDEMS